MVLRASGALRRRKSGGVSHRVAGDTAHAPGRVVPHRSARRTVIADRTLAIRLASLYGPAMLVALALLLQRPTRARATGAFLASAWNLPALLLVNVVAVRVGWWTFAP